MLILLYLFLSIIIIILLSTKFKLNPALSLLIGGISLGVFLEIGLINTLLFQFDGFINSIKGIGLLIFFSCIIGQVLKETNSIKKFGNIILNSFRSKSLFSLNILGLFIGTVVFCDSAFLILNGISRSIASSSSLSLTSLNLSLSGGLYSSHTLEHLTDPNYFFNSISKLLKPKGKVFIEVPNCRRLPIPKNYAEGGCDGKTTGSHLIYFTKDYRRTGRVSLFRFSSTYTYRKGA